MPEHAPGPGPVRTAALPIPTVTCSSFFCFFLLLLLIRSFSLCVCFFVCVFGRVELSLVFLIFALRVYLTEFFVCVLLLAFFFVIYWIVSFFTSSYSFIFSVFFLFSVFGRVGLSLAFLIFALRIPLTEFVRLSFSLLFYCNLLDCIQDFSRFSSIETDITKASFIVPLSDFFSSEICEYSILRSF